MSRRKISNPSLVMNNLSIVIVGNSFSYTEGLGEQDVVVQSAGGGSIQTVFTDNVEMRYSDIKFEMQNTAENIDLIRTWKINENTNGLTGTAPGGVDAGWSRTFNSVVLTSNYEVNLGSDTTISLEFKSDPAI